MRTTIPMFFAIDDNYANYFLVTLNSIIENASRKYNYDVNILYTNLSNKTKKTIKAYNDPNFNVHFIDMNSKIQGVSELLCTRDYYTKTTYFRLFITNMFKNIDKALYLDSDIVVLDDVSKLYETNIEDSYVAAAPDQSVKDIKEFQLYVSDCLGLDHTKYFNAGILVMNFKKMREENFEDQIINLLKKYEFKVAQDQDLLNVVCKDKSVMINCSWNQMPFGKRNNNASIIHYNLIYKPWKMNDVMYEEYFWKYAIKAGKAEEILRDRGEIIFEDESKLEGMMESLKLLCVEEANNDSNYYNIAFQGV